MSLIKGLVTTNNLQKICKICLEEKTSVFNLGSLVTFKNLNIPSINIGDIFKKVTSQINHGRLQLTIICLDCLQQLQVAYLLLLRYEEANKILQEFLTKHMTKESGKDIQINEGPNEIIDSIKTEKTESETDSPETSEKPVQHSCPICFEEFTALQLREHVHTHKGLKKYLNFSVDKKVPPTTRFSTKRHLISPQVTIFQRSEIFHKCPHCNMELSSEEFKSHVNHHKQGEYKCDKCKRVFQRINHLSIHQLKHLKELPYKCEQCGKGFIIKTNYDCHILAHANKLPHACGICSEKFANPRHLQRHMYIHTENVTYSEKYFVSRCNRCRQKIRKKNEPHVCVPVKRPTTCNICKIAFTNLRALNDHKQKIHNLNVRKTVPCSICDKHVTNIYQHRAQHTGKRPGQCHKCGKMFNSRTCLSQHLLTHVELKPNQCNQCGKRFTLKAQLSRHLMVHSGEKPFICSVCGKTFNNMYNLQVHERTHTGTKNHICNICNKRFLEASYLKRHMNVHTKFKRVKTKSEELTEDFEFKLVYVE